MNFIAYLHERFIFKHRIRCLVQHLAELIPKDASVLDIGCGDGQIDRLLADLRPDLKIQGIDVLIRPNTLIQVLPFDGIHVPFQDKSFDVTLFVDVLHHTPEPRLLLAEARRVSQSVIIKDHDLTGFAAKPTLCFMDWVGNAPHGVALPYNYWPKPSWLQAFHDLGLSLDVWKSKLRLYPPPFSFLFDRQLHFIAKLKSQR